MKIVSYNLNGVRAACKKGLNDWISNCDVDIFCFQETRATQQQICEVLNSNGYYAYYNVAEKLGYSGTCILTRQKPKEVFYSLPSVSDNMEGRLILAKFDGFSVLNYYTPNGGTRLEFKYLFMEKVLNDIKDIIKSDELIICTDFNIAHTELDVTNPKVASTRTGFLLDERRLFDDYLNIGLYDSFRLLHPREEAFTWSSYSSKMTDNNVGIKYRFDYIFTTEFLSSKLLSCKTLLDKNYSDHYPVLAEFNF